MPMREFESIADFAIHLGELHVAVRAAEHHALEKVARIIEKDAQNRIGHYQDAVGPFSKWDELADGTEKEKERLGYPAGAPLLRTGDLQKSIEHEVRDDEAVIGSKMDIAAYQEFGTDKIPPRPFIGPAAFNNKDRIQRIFGAAIVEGLTGGEKIHELLGYDINI